MRRIDGDWGSTLFSRSLSFLHNQNLTSMSNYIDGFVLPIPKKHIDEYRQVASQIAEVWKGYGALQYFEYVGDDMHLEGTRSFNDATVAGDDEVVVFGWVVFPDKETRDSANAKVPVDPRMTEIVAPLVDPSKMIFNASKMIYGGFRSLV